MARALPFQNHTAFEEVISPLMLQAEILEPLNPRDVDQQQSLRGLDWLNFLLADVQTGVGPFLAIYLASYRWNEQRVGLALTIGGIAGIVSQTPAGGLVDQVNSKRFLIAAGVIALAIGALLIAYFPSFWPVVIAFAKDGSPGRPSARCAALCAAAASIGPARSAWLGGFGRGFGLDAVLSQAADWHVLATAWCAAAAGWLLAELAPLAARAVLEIAAKSRAARLRVERARLCALWGWAESADSEL